MWRFLDILLPAESPRLHCFATTTPVGWSFANGHLNWRLLLTQPQDPCTGVTPVPMRWFGHARFNGCVRQVPLTSLARHLTCPR